MWILDELEKLKETERVAVRYKNDSITYKELWKRSECIGAYFIAKGLDKKPIVIYGNKEIDIIPCMHAALKIGIPYVPVDTLYPVERLKKIAAAVEADVVINFSDVSDVWKNCISSKEIYEIYRENMFCGGVKSSSWVKDEDICYILFTSGSTGEPKGVPICKRNLVNFSTWFSKYFSPYMINKATINQAPYSFDLSVIGLYVCLPLGNYLVNIDKDMSGNFPLLDEYIEKYKPNIWISTPSFMKMCMYDQQFLELTRSSIEEIIFDGEVLTKDLAKDLLVWYKDAKLINAYGPTEATVAISACEITAEMLMQAQELPIGYLITDGEIEIRQDYVSELGDVVGELYISSRSVAKEYYNSSSETEKVFSTDTRGLRRYNTGDLVYMRDGLLYYVGRKDFQIKLNGYRIEVNDIEANLQKLDYISSNCVIPVKENNKLIFLCAFVVLCDIQKENDLKMSIRIKQDLAHKLPAYMVPKKIVFMDELPLNVNGKIDRKMLLEGMNSAHK